MSTATELPLAARRRAARKAIASGPELTAQRDTLARRLQDVKAKADLGEAPAQLVVVVQKQLDAVSSKLNEIQTHRQFLIATCEDESLLATAARLRRSKGELCARVDRLKESIQSQRDTIAGLERSAEQLRSNKANPIYHRDADEILSQIEAYEKRIRLLGRAVADLETDLKAATAVQAAERQELADCYERMTKT